MKPIKPIIVLDDDPTGTQTVHQVPVLTLWGAENITEELKSGTSLFYILTNSRAMLQDRAVALAKEIGTNIRKSNTDCFLISRGDSTLRGHFPAEVDALAEAFFKSKDYLIVLAPAFFEGQRVTKDDIHYIKEEDKLNPVAQTPFAKDKTFGYRNSNLRDWVIEKSQGQINASEIDSISLSELEQNNEELILQKIELTGRVLIINATSMQHFESFAAVLRRAKRKIILRTAASFVPVLGQIAPKKLLEKNDFEFVKTSSGGLIVVGSHVPQTNKQLEELLKTNIAGLEFCVEEFLEKGTAYLTATAASLRKTLHEGVDLVLYTSRRLISNQRENESLLLSVKVSEGLVYLVKSLQERPAFLIAKGGITSSDIATKALGIKRAIVLGQILPGVPVWSADEQCRFPGLSYVVFPGNVGDAFGLLNAYQKLQ